MSHALSLVQRTKGVRDPCDRCQKVSCFVCHGTFVCGLARTVVVKLGVASLKGDACENDVSWLGGVVLVVVGTRQRFGRCRFAVLWVSGWWQSLVCVALERTAGKGFGTRDYI